MRIRVVIADREEVFREGLAKLLESEPDIEVVSTCSSILEVVESVHKYQPDVTLVHGLSNGTSGIEVAQRISEEQSKTNIIVLTHSETDGKFISAIRGGVKAYLSKYVSIKSLIRTIILVAEGGVVISPPMAVRLLTKVNFLGEGKSATTLLTLLSKREQEVLSLVAQGFTNREIAAALVISDNTVKVHLRETFRALGVTNRTAGVREAERRGYLQTSDSMISE